MPHPPIIIPEIGRGEEFKIQNTINSMNTISEEIKSIKPETIIVISPHGSLFRDAVSINYDKPLKGDFSQFGNTNLEYSFRNDIELVDKITFNSGKENIPVVKIDNMVKEDYAVDSKVDHGVLVPLYFINDKYKNYKLVHITYGFLSREELYKFGMIIKDSVNELGRRAVIIASGDLSHKLLPSSPAGYTPKGKEFDNTIMELIKLNNRKKIMQIDYSYGEKVGECGLRSIQVMLGALDGFKTQNEVLSYEGPFGVGYGCASFDIIKKDDSSKLLNVINDIKHQYINHIRENEDEYVKLARMTLETYVRSNSIIGCPTSFNDKRLYNDKAGVFVSIKKDGELRGCIGTIEPSKNSIGEEIIANAVSSGTRDPRFYPVDEEELSNLVYSVDVLMPAEKINNIEELDVRKYGVIVRKGHKTGLLLPNLEGVETPQEQVSIALKKAGINFNDEYTMERFEVVRHK